MLAAAAFLAGAADTAAFAAASSTVVTSGVAVTDGTATDAGAGAGAVVSAGFSERSIPKDSATFNIACAAMTCREVEVRRNDRERGVVRG